MSKPDLVEPTGQPVNEAQVSASGVAQKAASVDTSQSAAASIFRGMQDLPPARTDAGTGQTAAQRASQSEAPKEEQKEKKEFPPIGQSDVQEHKKVETRADEPAPEGSALEGFRKGHQKARREKRAAMNAGDEERKDEQSADASTKTDSASTDAPPANGDDDTPVTEEEIQKTIADPGISKRHQKRMIHLANKAKELETKLKELESKPQSAGNDAKIKELEDKQSAAEKELIQYRRRYSLESEPELKKFDEIATKADEAIYGKLKEAGLSDKTLELIKSMGGFDGFSRSSQTFTVNVRNNEGELVPTVVTGAQLARQWLNDMNVADAEYLKAKLGERFNAIDNKKRRADELAAGAETWFKEQQEQYQKAVQEHETKATEYRTGYEKRVNDWLATQEALKDKPIPATASAEERKEIEDYNRHNAGVRALVKAAVQPPSLDDHVAIVQEAAQSLIHVRENRALKKELAALKEQLAKVQKGFSTTGKGGGASIQTVPKKKDDSAAAQLATSSTDSLRESMEKLRNGGGNDD